MHQGELKRNLPIQKNRLLFLEEVIGICIFGIPLGKSAEIGFKRSICHNTI